MNSSLHLEIEIADSTLRKHIKRGWVRGVSMSGDGQMSFVPVYPRWYKAWLFVKRIARNIWWKIIGRRWIDGVSYDKDTGILHFGDPVPKDSKITAVYEYRKEK